MSISFSLEEHVSAGPEYVFAIATDLDRAKDWMNGLVGIEVVGSGPFGKGTRWAETRRMFGKNATEHFEVTEYEPPSKICLYVDGSKGSSKKGEYFFTYVIEECPAGCKVTLFGRTETPGRLTAVLAKPFGGFFKRAMRKDLRSMKAYAERSRPVKWCKSASSH